MNNTNSWRPIKPALMDGSTVLLWVPLKHALPRPTGSERPLTSPKRIAANLERLLGEEQ